MGVFFAVRPYLQFDYSYQARVSILLFAFILISFVINAKVSFGEGSLTSVSNSVFYLFCFSTFLFFQTVSQGDIFRLCRALRLACVAALIIQAALVLLDIGRPHGARTVNFFNNPNQLAYFTLMVTLIAYQTDLRSRFTSPRLSDFVINSCVLISCTALMVESGSLATHYSTNDECGI